MSRYITKTRLNKHPTVTARRLILLINVSSRKTDEEMEEGKLESRDCSYNVLPWCQLRSLLCLRWAHSEIRKDSREVVCDAWFSLHISTTERLARARWLQRMSFYLFTLPHVLQLLYGERLVQDSDLFGVLSSQWEGFQHQLNYIRLIKVL